MVALSFASDAEANIFYKTVTATIANRSKKRRSRKFSPTKTDGSHNTAYDSNVVLRNQNSTGNMFFSINKRFVANNFLNDFLRRMKRKKTVQ